MKDFIFKKENILVRGKKDGDKEKHLKILNRDVYNGINGEGLSYEEVEKTKEDFHMIESIREWLSQYLQKLSIQKNFDDVQISDQIHFVQAPKEFSSYYILNTKNIEINNKFHGYQRYAYTLHEVVHLLSTEKVYVEEEDGEIKYKIRNGYSFDTILDEFNEAITEKVTREILKENAGTLAKQIGEDEGSLLQKIEEDISYKEYRKVLDIIINKTAQSLKLKEDDLWKDIKKGYFSGEMMHLRKLEQVYGKGFLRFFASFSQKLNEKEINFDTFLNLLSKPEKFQEFMKNNVLS